VVGLAEAPSGEAGRAVNWSKLASVVPFLKQIIALLPAGKWKKVAEEGIAVEQGVESIVREVKPKKP
jgi:hypothetical protein